MREGHNLSAFERNRTFLNVGGKHFIDVSYLTSADSQGDGRAVVAGDFRNTGQMDLAVRQIGGGPFLLFENRFPKRNYLKISLLGKDSNRLGIGARIIAQVGDLKITREMFPVNSYQSQAAAIVHIGLNQATAVDRLDIRWPSGEAYSFKNVRGNRHILVREAHKHDASAITTVVPGQTMLTKYDGLPRSSTSQK